MPRKILVVGSGGREHAIVRQLAVSVRNPELYCAPGNPGTAKFANNVALDVMDIPAVTAFCVEQSIDLVIIGPEDPLIAGLADALHREQIPVFGPGATGARLEGDKEFAKEVLAGAGVPTARFAAFSTSNAALKHMDKMDLPVVIKACGAAQGKGVAVCASREEAETHIRYCLDDQAFGGAGLRILIEECLFGPELSVLVVTDGQDYCLLAPSRDHKRIGENGCGPNTGGMGAFAPVDLPDELYGEIDNRIVLPVLAELRRRDIPYRGVLYIGLMLTDTGPQVLEFNCRFGDPETQVVLPLFRGDFLDFCSATATGTLGDFMQGLHQSEGKAPDNWTGADLTAWQRHSVVVVAAADGYPGTYLKGKAIEIPDLESEDQWIIQAGTAEKEQKLVTAGGRVLGAVGMGPNLEQARVSAYKLLEATHFEGLTFRRDIGDLKETHRG
jgi:phosphoribosylamine---glycine ligase